jgi:hypothetical protein
MLSLAQRLIPQTVLLPRIKAVIRHLTRYAMTHWGRDLLDLNRI